MIGELVHLTDLRCIFMSFQCIFVVMNAVVNTEVMRTSVNLFIAAETNPIETFTKNGLNLCAISLSLL